VDGKGLKIIARRGHGFWIFGYRNGNKFSSTCLGTLAELTPAAARKERNRLEGLTPAERAGHMRRFAQQKNSKPFHRRTTVKSVTDLPPGA
jgi:hypothetical protein